MSLPGEPSFSYETSPELFLFTSLTAGSSHITTATSRLITILKARRVPFHIIDIATDEKARRIWTRRSGGKKLPGLVKQGDILADLETVEEWNEYGEVNQHLGAATAAATATAPTPAPAPPIKLPTTDENINPNPNPITTTLPFRSRPLESDQLPQTLAGAPSPATPPMPHPHAPQPLVDASKMRSIPPALAQKLGLPATDSPATSAESTPRRETSPVAEPADLDSVGGAAEVPGAGLEAVTADPQAGAGAGLRKTSLPRQGSGLGLAAQTHRGSEISLATDEEIKAVEANNRIQEEDEDEEDEDDAGRLEMGAGKGKKSDAGVEVKGAKAADASKAEESVGD